MKRFSSPLMFGALSGFLVVAAYNIPHAWMLITIALLPLLHAIQKAKTVGMTFFAGLVSGIIIVGGTTFWMFYAKNLPPDVGLSPTAQLIAIFVSWALIILFTAPCIGVFALLSRCLDIGKRLDILAMGVLWVGLEYARMHTFNIISRSTDVSNPAFWSTGFVGYPLADSINWLQAASIGGVFTLSFLVVCMNAALYFAWATARSHSEGQRRVGGVVLVLLLITFLPIASWRSAYDTKHHTTDAIQVGIVSLYFDNNDLHLPSIQKQITDATEELSRQGARVVLLPEGASYHTASSALVRGFSTTTSPIIVDSGRGGTLGNTFLFWSYANDMGKTETLPLRSKMMLTPQGEYVIELFRVAFTLVGKEEMLTEFGKTVSLTNGSMGDPLTLSDARASILFCFEIFAPGFGHKLVTTQASDFLLVMISHSRFRHSRTLEQDTLRFVKVQTVNAGVPSAVSASNAAAFALDKYGNTLRRVGQHLSTETALVPLSIRHAAIPMQHEKKKQR